ncbi:DNA (cytosine-5)-methyltransferase 1 [freshwater sediment metagenome]|uniref:DNA (Cytosine-5)-methyltransferase 1 n=1 Tax=freshwater sediment metagenome TaxID=556182 RepID=A0AA48M295_9ZZZZ
MRHDGMGGGEDAARRAGNAGGGMSSKPGFYEFFAGGGMARAGLGPGWQCLFANDCDAKKSKSYRRNWGGGELHVGDVAAVTTAQLPGCAGLAWASFPCQDVSLAGARAGLAGTRSGAFWSFWRLVQALRAEGRAPALIVLENVTGLLSSHGGEDFAAICAALDAEGYRFGALVIDAAPFLPQSRPRLFIVGADETIALPPHVVGAAEGTFHPKQLVAAYRSLPEALRARWVWWSLPAPPIRNATLTDMLEPDTAVEWESPEEAARHVAMMAKPQLAKLEEAKRAGRRMVGAGYRRMRAGLQRFEVRFDGLAGTLRTAAGGSSRQQVLVVDGERVRLRWMAPREAARLMGLPDTYLLPAGVNDALTLAGDGLVVPVVRHIAGLLLLPVISAGALWRA